MIKAIIFDCFGVLVGKGIWHTYEVAGGDPGKDKAFIDDVIYRSNAGQLDSATFNQLFAQKLGLDLETWRQLKDIEEQPNMELFDYIRTELKSCYKIGFLSNVGHDVIERKIPSDLRELFDVDIRSADVGYQKPDPRIYQLALDKLGVLADEAVFTDDHEPYLAGAAALGIHTILYTSLEDFKSRLGLILVSS
jgi:epoxide hydrolase-like predicted phosphatase